MAMVDLLSHSRPAQLKFSVEDVMFRSECSAEGSSKRSACADVPVPLVSLHVDQQRATPFPSPPPGVLRNCKRVVADMVSRPLDASTRGQCVD